MSDLRSQGVKAMLGEEEVKLLFTLNVIDEIQNQCKMPLHDAMEYVGRFYDRRIDDDTVKIYRKIATILINAQGENTRTEDEIGEQLSLLDGFSGKILAAYGLSMPETDVDDELFPNVTTGQ